MQADDFLLFIAQYFPYILPVFFIVIWVIVVKAISIASGWKELAEKYPVYSPFSGETYRFQSMRMRRKVNFNNCLTIGANHMGLYLSMIFIFRIGHDPISIPWSEVNASMEEGRFTNYVRMSFSRSPENWIKISEKLFRKLERNSGIQVLRETV